MPIHAPGKRDKNNKKIKDGGRDVVAILSLTAMVDMFTVLVVFLLQNYKSTGEVLFLPKEVTLPQAQAVKELTPAHVVTVSEKFVFLDETPIVDFVQVKEQKDWLIRPLQQKLIEKIREEEIKYRENLKTRLQVVVGNQQEQEKQIKEFRKITIQADKKIDFMTIKKVMFTVTESGAEEINFSVLKKNDSEML